jgi:hypothetical protein
MMATVSPKIERNCIPTACSITQGNGACLINNLKKYHTGSVAAQAVTEPVWYDAVCTVLDT